MELIFGIVHGRCFADSHELLVEAVVHDGEHEEVQQSYHEQQRGKQQRSHNRVRAIDSKMLADSRCKPHGAEHAQTRDSHLQTHGQCHLLALEPFGKNLADSRTGHLAAAAEDHKAEHRKFGATGHCRPPGIEPCYSVGVRPRYTPVLDSCTDNHQRSRQETRETYTHLVEDDTGKDKEAEHIEQVLTCRIGAKHALIPAKRVVQQRCQWGQNVHKHVGKKHHRCNKHEHCPSCPCFIAK